MYKKILLAAVIFFVGFTISDFKAGEQITWDESLTLFIFAVAVFSFKEWVEIPYDWDKHKNKDKEKKNLS